MQESTDWWVDNKKFFGVLHNEDTSERLRVHLKDLVMRGKIGLVEYTNEVRKEKLSTVEILDTTTLRIVGRKGLALWQEY